MNKTDAKQMNEALTLLKSVSPILNQMMEVEKQREQIQSIITQLNSVVDKIEPITDDAINDVDNMSDRQRETYKGECKTELASALERGVDDLKSCISRLEDAVSNEYF